MTMRIGPAGLGGSVQEAASSLEKYSKIGFRACEIPFTYGVFIKEDKHKKQIVEIREAAKKYDIKLSIHAPYWLNFNSSEKKKIDASKQRVLKCCKIGELIGAKIVVFHAGFYSKMDKEASFQNIKKAVLDMLEEIKSRGWKIKIAAETMGKVNIFGSSEEILRLVKETGCSFCLDFAHLWAREQGKISYKEIYEKFKSFPEIHAHFSGIEFSSKGETRHKETPEQEIKKLLESLPKDKKITIINEAPNPVQDAVKMVEIWKKI